MEEADEGELQVEIPPEVIPKPINGITPGIGDHGSQHGLVGAPSDATSIPAADNHTSLPSLTIRIDYRLNDPEAGLYFVFPDDEVAPQRHPHMYTHNQASFTRFWMPCIDKSQERCTWEIYCIVPASERDALSPRQRENLTTEAGEDELPMIAVCSGTLIEQSELPDPRKRLFSFLVETPVAASSILLAVGPFQQVPIESWTKKTGQPPQVPEEDSFDYLLDESEDAEPVGYSFCLPGREDEVAYTTEFLGEAAEFLENYLGTSYPFPSYQQVFMEDTFSPLSTGSGINFFSSHLLLRSDVIDQTYESRRLMCRALAMQWIVHYIPPKTWADVWLTTGLAYYITGLFLEKHFGTNEYKYRLKKDMSRVCELDVHQPPLYPVVPSDLDGLPPGPKMIDPLMLPHYHPDDTWSSLRSEFLTLKAPIVIHMLDVRMGKGVVQTVIKKILVSAMSGELPAGLSTHHFLKVARKISEKPEIKTFADQWIYASGCPRFSFQYHFNARKMVLQFKFSQQSTSKGDFGSAPKFTGSFTLRVHGPVDTVDREIHIENTQQSFEIVYNNDMVGRRARKKSLKKARSVLGAADDMADEIDIPDAGVNDGVFEWIRIDPDNEWLCVKEFEQTDYMWAQQLRKDRDVVAQLEAIDALLRKPSRTTAPLISKLIADSTIFYRLRADAVFAFAKCGADILREAHLPDVMQMYKNRYCWPSPTMTIPRLNNFGDLQEYYLQKAMPLAISTIRTDNGTTPVEVRRFLVDLLEYNDNSNNEHSDNYFIASLLTALGDAFLPEVQPEKKPQSLALSAILSDTVVEVFNFADSDDEGEDNLREIFETDEGINLFKVAVKQIQRYIELDRIMPTYHNTVTVACLSVLTRWMLAGLVPVNLVFFLKHARYGHFLHVRMAAIDALFLLDGLHDEDVASYLLGLIRDDPAPFVRYHVAKTMATIMSLGAAEFNEANKAVSAEPAPMSKKASGWLKFKGDITQRSKFSTEVWNVMNHTPTLDHRIRLFLLKFCECLYEPAPGMVTAQPLKIKVGSKRAKSGQGYSSSDDEAVPSHPPKRGKTEKTTERPKPAVNGVKKRRSEAGVPAVKAVQPMEPPPPIEAAFLTTGEEILTRLLNHPSAAPFIHKVDETYAPGYSRMVQHPMDLSTVGRKLRSGSYANDIQLLAADVRQIFANCYIYNVEGSQVHNQAKKLEAFFDGEVLPEALGLKERPPPEEPPIKIEPLQVPVRAPAAPRRPSASNKPVSRRASSTPAPPASTQAPMTLLTQEESKRCRAMLKKLNSQKAAMWFKQPVDPMAQGIPTYFTIIKRPMDLSTVKAKLDNKQYTSLDDFESDIRLIFSNSFTFNPPDSPVYKDAASLLAYFQREWAQETASSAVVLSPSELSRCEAALQKMESRTAWVAPFLVPVDRSLFPHYYATTKEPIDISTIRKKLHSGTYSTTNEFEADVQLMFRNCFTFNLPGDPVYKQGLDLKQVFEEVWQGSGKDGASASKSELVATPAGRKERGGSEKTDATARKPKGKTLQTQSSLPPAGGEAESPVVSKSPSIVARVSRLLPSSPEGKICFKVLQRIQSQRMAGPFLVPVDPVALGIPQYFDIIKYPMDLGTVREKLDAGEYESAAAFADDMRLIFANAVAFNPPDHLVHQHAQALDKLFRKEWKAAGLDGRSGTPVSKASPTRSSPPTSSNNASRASPMSDPPTEISSSVQQKIREILRKLREHPRAGIFIGPVDGSIYADYYDKIKRPTDLATMETKLNNHAFATMQDFEAEFKQMIANCFTYNGKASEPAKWAMALEKAFKKEWAALTEKKATPTGTAKKRGAGSSRAGSTDPKSGLPQDARRECGLILDQLMQHPQALIFNTPVPRDVPGYHKAIKTPMDFGTIKQKLSENSYGSVHAFEADVRLVFSNCYKFNPAGGEVFRAMQSINELFDKAWKTFKGGKKRTADDFSDPEDIADAGKQKKTKQKHKKEEPPEDAEMDGDNPRKRSASAISYTKDGGVADRGKKKQKNERGDGDDGGKDDTNTPPAVSKPLKLKLKVKS